VAIKILVVDDERSIADSVTEILDGAGYEAVAAYSAADALAKASESCPNILLTDVLMPGKNGFDLALEIKQLCPDARLLLFSGQASTAQLASTYGPLFTSRGYRFELLPKPLHPASLLKKLEETLMHAA
jgi:DNA-binding NtrC family response regulator